MEATDTNALLLKLLCAQELPEVLVNVLVLGLSLQRIRFHRPYAET